MASSPNVARSRGSRVRVLVAEQDADARTFYVYVLKRYGFDVYEACDSEAANRLLTLINFDLIVLDAALPRRDGELLSDAVAERARKHDIPVVLISASDVNPARLHAQQVLRKPFQPDRLVAAVASVFAALGE